MTPKAPLATGVLTSARAPRVAAARRLAKRSFRAAERRFLVEGPQAVAEALADPAGLLELFVTPDAGQRPAQLARLAGSRGVPVHLVSGEVMGAVAQTVTPQGIVGVAAFRESSYADIVAAAPRLVVVLAAVRDPGNAGTVLRCADAAGADAVVFADSSVDPYNGKCVRASAGSLFHLPFAYGVPTADAVAGLRAAGLTVLAADGAGDTDLDALATAGELGGPTCWVFGNEAWGLPEDLRALADRVVRVPIHGRAESLNLATAAAVCLYDSARAQRAPGGCRADIRAERS